MAIITVTTLDDTALAPDGEVSLREALLAANTDTSQDGSTAGSSDDTIVFDPSLSGTLTLDQGELVITTNVTVVGDTDGDNRADIEIDADGSSRVFNITGGTVTLDALAMIRGDAGGANGGGLYVGAGLAVTIANSAVAGNSALDGGGIFLGTGAALTLINSIVAGNSAEDGGGIYGSSVAEITLTNSTLSGNEATGQGGGIYGLADNIITLTNATVTGNSADIYGGGIYDFGDSAVIRLANSIVVGNAAANPGDDLHGGAVPGDYAQLAFAGVNIIGSAPVHFSAVTGPAPITIDGASAAELATVFANVAPDGNTGVLAGVLADNGGTVPTVALNRDAANPGLNSGDATRLSETTAGIDLNGNGDTTDTITTDARGFARNVGGVDLGAFEQQAAAPAFIVTTLEDGGADDFDGGNLAAETADGDGLSLREALGLANDDPTTVDAIGFDPSLAGGTLTLVSGELVIAGDVALDGDIDGDDAFDITVSGDPGNPSAVFHFYSGASVLNGMRITGGNALYGAGVSVGSYATYGYADVMISNAVISNNFAGYGGGISVDNGSSLYLVNSTVTQNEAYLGGGIAVNDGGGLYVLNSTISDNEANQPVLGVLGYGGGIANAGSAALINTTVSGNSAYVGGGIYNSGLLALVNTTLAHNDAAYGGGLYNADCGCGVAALSNSTVSGNYAVEGGGIYNAAGLVNLTNSIVAGNSAGYVGPDILNLDVATYMGVNLFSQAGVGDAQDIVATDLANIFASVVSVDLDGGGPIAAFDTGLLADNGGPVQTIAIRPDSVARNAGDAGELPADVVDLDGDNDFAEDLPVDARGFPRVALGGLDIGAFELQTPPSHDLNGDRHSDIVWRNDAGTVVLWTMDGVHVLANNVVATLPAYWNIVDAESDFDGDGRSDLLWRDDAGAVVLWEMDGSSVRSNTALGTLPTSWQIEDTGDFSGDGHADILWRDDAGRVVLWEMDGATIVNNTLVADVATTSHIETTGDFNDDGTTDILWHDDAGTFRIWEMDGATVLADTVIATLPDYWEVQGTGDFNRDNRADIVWRDTAGTVVLWEMDGPDIIGNTALGTLPDYWQIADIGDYTADRAADILWRDDSGTVVLWQMDGATIVDNTAVNTISTSWHIVA